MQFSFQTLITLAALPAIRLALAQADPGPSPTASIGCVPHGDHWDCEGPAPTVVAQVSISASSSIALITTTTSTSSASSTTAEAHDHEDHDHEEEGHEEEEHTDALGSGTIAPSPTASIGCEPHGDHWHCDGPRTVLTTVAPVRTISNTTASATSTPSVSVSVSSTTPAAAQSVVPTGGAVAVGASIVGGFLGLIGAFAL